MTADWMPSQSTIDAIKADCPGLDIRYFHQEFVDYWLGRSGREATKVDWDATWRNRMRDRYRNAPPPRSTNGAKSTTDERVAATLRLAAQYAIEDDDEEQRKELA